MYRICCFLLLLLLCNHIHAQEPILQWAKEFGSPLWGTTAHNNGRSVAVDAEGNVYTTGLFFMTLDFDPGPGVFEMTPGGQFGNAIYISKLSPDGEFIWAKQFPLSVESPVYLALDRFANVYLTSEIRYAADMDPGPGVHMITPIGSKDAFVIKLSSDGNFQWVKQFGGTGDTVPGGSAITIDNNDDVIVCGGFNRVVDFDPGPGTFTLTAAGTLDAFVVKLSTGGEFIWARKMGSTGSIFHNIGIEDVVCDIENNIYMTGNFGGECDFDPGANNSVLQSGGPADGFVASLDASGNFVFAKKFGNSALNYVVMPKGIALDEKKNLLISGSFIGTQDFDPGSGIAPVYSAGAFDAFVLKLTSQGNFIWVRNIGGAQNDQALDVAVDNSENVYVLGLYYGIIDFNPGPGVATKELKDATVLSKFDKEGTFVYAAAFEGYSIGRRVVTDAAQNIYITGSFYGTVDFDPGPEVFEFDGGPNRSEIFVLKLAKCLKQTYSILDINSCGSYMLNGQVYETSGSYTQVMPNVSGCDSIITLHLAVNRKTTAQSISICEGESYYAGGANQTVTGIYIDTLQTVLGCDSIVTTTLTVNPRPNPALGPDANLCANSSLTIAPGLFPTYLWQDQSTQSSYTIQKAGTYWVTVTNDYQCAATDTFKILEVLQPPKGFLREKDSICSYDKVMLRPFTDFISYQWSNAATSKNIEVSAPGVYWLEVRDANGCSGGDTITLVPKQCISGVFIPTAFTPNNDGKNDVFKALAYGKLQSFKLQVFNRWGQLVFQTEDPRRGWDGKFGGVIKGSDVFAWICTYQLEGYTVKSEKGTVSLLQ